MNIQSFLGKDLSKFIGTIVQTQRYYAALLVMSPKHSAKQQR
jgi:hypothetical protein